MQNIYGQPGESLEKWNHEKQIALGDLLGQVKAKNQEIIRGEIGIEGERRVGAILNDLAGRNPKYTVIHDVPFHWENIDHIVIYEDRIVIIIETKASSSIHYNKAINQVNGQRNYLKGILKVGYVKSFVCFSKYDKELHQEIDSVETTDPNSLVAEIEAHVANQVREYNPSRPKNSLTKIVLGIKSKSLH